MEDIAQKPPWLQEPASIKQPTWLSGYRLMWIIVMFDLPTDTKQQRKQANRFREFLLDNGFERSQFSIYARLVNGKESYNAHVQRIEKALPSYGEVQILHFTDKQYQMAIRFSDHTQQSKPQKQGLLALF